MSGNAGGALQDWQHMWGVKVKVTNQGNMMPDDMLRDCVEVTKNALDECEDFENDGLQVTEKVKAFFDSTYGGTWHVVIGRNFGSHCTHETKRFVYFYYGDKAVMVWRAGGVA
eukprot:g2010.t1